LTVFGRYKDGLDWEKITTNNYYVSIFQTFLADYGMVWIGEKSDPKSDVYNDEDISDSDSAEDLWRPGLNTFFTISFKFNIKIVHVCLITLFF
jgi:hypothetical protein